MERTVRFAVVSIMMAVVGSLFTNCGRIAPSEMMSSALGRDICSSRLKLAYEETYFPFLSNTCNSCHGSAHGSRDLTTSFNSFLSKPLTVIDYKSVTAHGGNSFSAAAHQPILDSFKPAYDAAYAEYSSCKSRLGNGDVFDLQLKPLELPTLPQPTGNNAQWKTLIWDTTVDAVNEGLAAKFKADVKIDVRAYVYQSNTVGLQFRDPRVTLKSGQGEVSVQGLKIYFNGSALNEITAYSSLNMNLTGTSEIQLAAGLGSPSAVLTVTSGDTVSLEFLGVSSEALGTAPGEGLPPIVDGEDLGNLPATVTLAELLTANTANGVFAASCVSCHSAGRMSGGLDLTNPTAAKNAAQNVVMRMGDGNRPMPTSGILDARSRKIVEIWATTGAN